MWARLLLVALGVLVASCWQSYARQSEVTQRFRNSLSSQASSTSHNKIRKAYSYSDTYTQLDVCEGSVVEVTEISTLCTSPNTFYYSSDGHTNSRFCDYGDKATVSVKLLVNENIDYLDDFYITMVAYDTEGNFLDSMGPMLLCKNFVKANDCAAAGVYGFSTTLNLRSNTQDLNNFIPVIQMLFTSGAHSGSLGAVNMDNCDNIREFWVHRQRFGDFLEVHGLILFTCIALLGMATFLYRRARALKNEDALARTASLMD